MNPISTRLVAQRARRTAVAAACALLAATAVAGPAPNDPTLLSLEQLLDLDVQSASKFTQKASEAPSSVTVVSAADIRRYGYRKLGDILNSVRGLYVHSDRNYDYLGVRGVATLGSYNSRILVMLDGYRLNDPIYGQGSIGLEFPVDVDLIDRVEFVPGPGSAIYGSNAFFGVVNVITRKGRDVGGFEIAASAGSAGTATGRATYGKRLQGDVDVLLSVSGLSSRGRDHHYAEFDQPGTSDGVARGLDYERVPNFFAKVSKGGFTFEAAHNVRTKGVPTASFGTDFNNPAARTRDRQSLAELRYDGKLGRDAEVFARVHRGAYRYDGHYPYADAASGSTVLNVDTGDSGWWGGEARVLSRAIRGHKIILGAEYRENTRKDQKNYDVNPAFSYLDERHRSSQTGLYVQDEIALRPDLVLNAGVRHDRYTTFGAITNPRLGLIYTHNPALTLKALYGRAYRAPNDGELFYSSAPSNWKASGTLRPERIATQELVGEWRVSSLTRMTASAFQYRISDLIGLGTDPADGFTVYSNGGSARVKGAQLEYEQLWTNGSAVRASYSFQNASDATGARLVNSPRQIAKLDAATPLWNQRLRAGFTVRHVGQRLTRAQSPLPAYTLADLTLTSDRLIAGAELSLGIYNLFNQGFATPVSDAHVQDSIRQDGRTLRLKFVARF